jgi:hypothetical protein
MLQLMAKVDCSELAKELTELAMSYAVEDDVKDLDDVVAKIQQHFPEIRRQSLVDAIVEATAHEQQKSDEISKKLKAIRQEARTDKKLNKRIEDLQNYLEEGIVPPNIAKSKTDTFVIEQLKKTKANLTKWLKTADPEMRNKLNERLAELKQQIDSGEINTTPEKKGKLHAEIQAIQDQIDNAKNQIADEKQIAKWQEKIDTLQEHIEEGTLPPKQERRTLETNELVAEMKDVVKDLRKQISGSEPAVKAKLEKQIADLEAKLESGDILPKTKEQATALSKDLEKLQYQRDMLRRQIREEIYNLKPRSIWERIEEPFNTVRAIMTTGEFSLVLRQGGIFIKSHPIKGFFDLAESFKAFGSDEQSYKINNAIINRDNAPFYFKGGMHLAPMDGTVRLSKMEEVYMARLIGKLPVIKNFQRWGLTFLNLIRADMFDMGVASLGRNGEITIDQAKVIGNMVNVSTGRGNLGALERVAAELNTVFFAPKFVASRFQFLLGQPIWGAGKFQGTSSARQWVAREYARYIIGQAVYLFLLALGLSALTDKELEVESNPTSADFMKLRIGNTRLDIWSGLSQTTVLLSRVISGEKKTTGGKIVPIRGEDVPFGGDKTPEVIARFLRGKLSPAIAIPLDIATGENVIGEPVTVTGQLKQRLVPITYGDIYDVMQELGIEKGAALSILTFFGEGLQTYQDKKAKTTWANQKY